MSGEWIPEGCACQHIWEAHRGGRGCVVCACKAIVGDPVLHDVLSAANGPSPTPSETRQDRIHRAAEKLRKLASAASPGPWVEGGYGDYGPTVINPGVTFGVETEDSLQGRADAAYLAVVDPGVGLATADLMEAASALGSYGELADANDRLARSILGEPGDGR